MEGARFRHSGSTHVRAYILGTRSLYIAAYFAFRRRTKVAKRVSIYVYCELPNFHKPLTRYEPTIISHGPGVRSHRRHFLQQSEYTSCLSFKSPIRFVPHEAVFKPAKRRQDFLWKFTLPSSEREKVLKLLDSQNLSAFSLFNSEESLMETVPLIPRIQDRHSIGSMNVAVWQKNRCFCRLSVATPSAEVIGFAIKRNWLML
jgi:hypothetical protein